MRMFEDFSAAGAVPLEDLLTRSLQSAGFVVWIREIAKTLMRDCVAIMQRIHESKDRRTVAMVDGIPIYAWGKVVTKVNLLEQIAFVIRQGNMILIHYALFYSDSDIFSL